MLRSLPHTATFPDACHLTGLKALPAWIALVVACMMAGCRPAEDGYTKNPPPRAKICGVWLLDMDRSTWKPLKDAVSDETVRPQEGRLRLKVNGQFSIEDLPDFSTPAPDVFVSRHNAGGTWKTVVDQKNARARLLLQYDKVNGQMVEGKSASADFYREGGNYFIYVAIEGEDGQLLVFRKPDKPVE